MKSDLEADELVPHCDEREAQEETKNAAKLRHQKRKGICNTVISNSATKKRKGIAILTLKISQLVLDDLVRAAKLCNHIGVSHLYLLHINHLSIAF